MRYAIIKYEHHAPVTALADTAEVVEDVADVKDAADAAEVVEDVADVEIAAEIAGAACWSAGSDSRAESDRRAGSD